MSKSDETLESRITTCHDILTFDFITNTFNFTYVVDKKDIRLHNPENRDIIRFMRDVTVSYLNKLLEKV